MDKLTINSFGALQVLCGDQPITEFRTDKTRALLIYLAVEGNKSHSRETLAGLLWSDQSSENALHNLRQAISFLRKILGDRQESEPLLLLDRDTVQINPNKPIVLDVAVFNHALQTAYRHYNHRHGTGSLNIRALKKAIGIYRGPFLDQFVITGGPLFEEWALLERESSSRQVIRALGLLAEYHERRGEYEQARQAAQRLVELAPWEENAHALIMRLLMIDGQWSAAQSQYMACRRILQDELDLEPSAGTESLFAELRRRAAAHQLLPPRFPQASTNLPIPDTPFVGRSSELDRLAELLADPSCRLITLLGMGGSGKTRLAIQAASDYVGLFSDGVFFVPLDGIDTHEELVGAAAFAVGFRFFGDRPADEQLSIFLRDKDCLLVLDSFEHLIKPNQEVSQPIRFILDLLKSSKRVKLLITTRTILNLRQENILDVIGLAYPDRGGQVHQTDAIDLFEQTARRWQSTFTASKDWGDIVDICRELIGIPLAIELAAGWVRSQTCSQILSGIRSDMDHISSTMKDIPERHRSLRAVFDHSWNMLSDVERSIFSKLAVFTGSFLSSAAEAICETNLVTLESLAQQSLLQRSSSGRYQMHALTRRFAAEKLSSREEDGNHAAFRFADYYARFLRERRDTLKSKNQQQALEEIDLELANLRTAWNLLVECGRPEDFIQGGEALFHYFNIRAGFHEGIQHFRKAIEVLERSGDSEPALGWLLTYLGGLAYRAHDNELAATSLERARQILIAADERKGLALCLVFWSSTAARRREHTLSIQAVEQSISLFQQAGDIWGESYALYLLGLYLNRQGKMDGAEELMHKSLDAARRSGDIHRQISPLNILGDNACQKGEYKAALLYFEESLTLCREIQDRYNEAMVELNMGTVYHLDRDYGKARQLYESSLKVCREIGDTAGQAMALSNLGELLVDCGEHAQAMPYFKQGLDLSREHEDEWSEISLLNNTANTCLELNNIQEAKYYLTQSVALVKSLNSPPTAAITLLQLARYLVKIDRLEQARELLVCLLHLEGLEEDIRVKANRVLDDIGVPTSSTLCPTLDEIFDRYTKLDN